MPELPKEKADNSFGKNGLLVLNTKNVPKQCLHMKMPVYF
jgi:hypothetical protein